MVAGHGSPRFHLISQDTKPATAMMAQVAAVSLG